MPFYYWRVQVLVIAPHGGHFYQKYKKAFLIIGIASNLLILFFFKYFNFFAESKQPILTYCMKK
jgi:hypothetical protein